MHDPGELAVDDVAALGAELEALRLEGKALAWGVSGDQGPTRDLAAAWPGCQVQWREDLFAPAAATATDPPPISFGVLSDALPRITAQVADPAERRRWSDVLGIDCGDPGAVAAQLLREALDRNARGGVLFATTRPDHLAAMVAAVQGGADDDGRPEALRRLAAECGGAVPVA